MKALVKTKEGQGNVCLMEVADKTPGPGQVKIRVSAVGICGTDVKIRHGDTWSNPPVILGHEYSGVVEEVGEGVVRFKPGDRVISETAQKVCGNCYYCKTANELMCPERLSIGYGTDGAMAEYCVVREGIVHKLPDGVSLDDGAVCEPAAVAVHAVYDKISLLPTDKVLVMGPGPIGLLVAQAIKATGCTTILAGTEQDRARLQVGKTLGMDHTIDVTKEDLSALVAQTTGGMGVDAVFDCTGAAPAIRAAMGLLKKKGNFVQVGLTKQSIEIEYGLLTQREISILGTFGHNWKSWETVLQMIEEGKLDVSAIVTHHFNLEQWEEAFAVAEKQEGIKILLHP